MATWIHRWQTRRWRLLGLAVGVGYLALTLEVLVPAGRALWHQRAQMAVLQTQLAQTQTWAATARQTHARVQRLQGHLRRVHATRTSATGLDALVTPLAAAAQQAGLTVTALTADTTRVQARQVAWPLHLQATGRYHQVRAFLDHLEHDAAPFVIDRLALTAPRMANATLTLHLDLTRYQLQPPQETP